ncbi:unnamed protein product [Prunus armeniaca]|uniref:SWIM-type domain-containing protein n=2 Tax=Prunus armeniaca TaxID=36596 RepID=A0A6J5XUH3_PRUAR|nr:unnamed protein product [Prunus armeniaca]
MNVSKHQIYRAKNLSKVIIEGSYVEQYARLWDYVEKLKKANKGSTMIIKNKMKGTLHWASFNSVGIDGNNGLYPVAYAVVETSYSNLRTEHAGLAMKNILWVAARATTIPWMAIEGIAGMVWRHPVGPRIVKIIEKNKLGASQCIPRLAGESKYQVSHMYRGEYVVDLKAKTCSVRRWDLCGIPCSHAISCIFQKEANVFDYAHDCYKKDAYLSSYEPMVHPIPSMDQWQRTNWPPIKPPPYKKQPGRPRKSRNKGPADVEVLLQFLQNPLPPFYNPPPTRSFLISQPRISCLFYSPRGNSGIGAHPNQPNPTRGRGRGRGTTTGRGRGNGRGEMPLEEEMLEMGQQKCQTISHHHNHSHHHPQPLSYTRATSSSSQPPKSHAKRFKSPTKRVKSPVKRFKCPAMKLKPWMF